jgi:F420-dependent oxidoreductase-like protein
VVGPKFSVTQPSMAATMALAAGSSPRIRLISITPVLSGPVRVCLMIEGQEGVTWDQWRALATTAEEAGFEALFRSDHYESLGGPPNRGSLDAWSTISALAALTTTLRLGTLVSPATFRHPSVLARAAVTVDHVSGGRVELGMGAGWHEGEHRSFGFPFETTRERFDRLAEQLEIVHRSWGEDPFDFDGRYYRLERADAQPKPLQQPHPNLIVGGSAGPRGAALAARWADEYNTVYPTPEQARERRERIAAACARAGRDPLTFSAMVPLDGSRDELVQRLRGLADAGVDRVMLQHLAHDDLEAVELVGREVIPAL